MQSISINIQQILLDKRMEISELAKESGVTRATLYTYAKKQSITIKGLRKIETVLGDCTQYIKEPEQN